MIFAYGVSQQGAYHIESNTVLQDAYKIKKLSNNICIAAVADGLGSEKHSDIASKLAVETSTDYCLHHIMRTTDEKIIEIIANSFALANQEIEVAAKENNHDPGEYGTTLSLAVLINDKLYFGHAGDSGIIALTTDGQYIKVTTQQRDNQDRVFPLNNNQEYWVFGKSQERVTSVLLATDGMYELLFPIYIRNQEVNIYVNLARFLMDNDSLQINVIGENATKDRIAEYINDIPGDQVDDDKTVVVLVNTSIDPARQPDEYYQDPDWETLKSKFQENFRRQAYPHLYPDENHDDNNDKLNNGQNSENQEI